MKTPLLLNPGPVTLSPRVRAALTAPDLCHREPEFYDLQDEVRRALLAVYGLDPARWSAVLLTGSGTAAVEAMISSLVPDGGALLVLENGPYGERMTQMAQRHGIVCERLHHAWGQALALERVAAALRANTKIRHVAAVHHETASGRLNDLAALAQLCRGQGAQLLLDGVSSFGAEPIAFDESIAACAATANKCLHGAPGISFVLVRREALTQAQPRTVYLDLAAYARAQDLRNTPFTPAVHVLHALAEAAREHAEEGGWNARGAHYLRLQTRVAGGLAALGVEPLIPASESSCVLRAYRLPAGMDYAPLHEGLKQRGFVIYAGQGAWAKEIFRIATMGALDDADIARLVEAFGDVLQG